MSVILADEKVLDEPNWICKKQVYVYSNTPEAELLADFCIHTQKELDYTFMGYVNGSVIELSKETIDDTIAIILPYNDDAYTETVNRLLDMTAKNVYFVTGYAFFIYLSFNVKRFSEKIRNWFYWKGKQREVIESLNTRYVEISDMSKDCPVLVYSPQKTGSTSLWRSINSIGIAAVHTHHWEGWTNDRDDYQKKLGEAKEYWKNRILLQDRIRIITCVREPLARRLSYCFESTNNYHMFYNTDRYINFWDYINCSLVEDAFGLCGSLSRWHDEELKKSFGIDLLLYDFDKEKGFGLITKDNVDVLVLTLEKMNRNTDIIREFINNSVFCLKKENVSDNKSYKYLYGIVRNHIKIEDKLLDYYYGNNAFLNHFYTSDDISSFRKKWESQTREQIC